VIVWHAQEGKANEILKTISKRKKFKSIGKQIKEDEVIWEGKQEAPKEKVSKRIEYLLLYTKVIIPNTQAI